VATSGRGYVPRFRRTGQPAPRPVLSVKVLYKDKRGRTVGEFPNLLEAKRLAVRLLKTEKDIVRTKVTSRGRRIVEYKRNFLGRVRQA